MVQVIENWVDVTGKLLALEPHPKLADHRSARLEVTVTSDVPGFPNLARWAVGKVIDVVVPAGTAEASARVGDQVTWRVRSVGPNLFSLRRQNSD